MRLVCASTIVCVGALAAACSNTASQILETGSIFGGTQSEATAATPPPQPTATDRALQVAAVSARAQKCGYVFDPAALRQAFLAAEAASGVSVADLGGLSARYDYTAREVAKRIAPEADYCSADRTRVIKADLNRHLAGDFAPRRVAAKSSGGLLDSLASEHKTELDPNWGRDQSESPTRAVKN